LPNQGLCGLVRHSVEVGMSVHLIVEEQRGPPGTDSIGKHIGECPDFAELTVHRFSSMSWVHWPRHWPALFRDHKKFSTAPRVNGTWTLLYAGS
jgi:hypothetical protein